MSFADVLLMAKEGDHDAIVMLLDYYKPLLTRESYVSGFYDEDMYQELCVVLLNCIRKFTI